MEDITPGMTTFENCFRARGTAGLRGLEHPHFFAVIMFQIREVREM